MCIVIDISLSNRLGCEDNRFPLEVEIAWGDVKRLAETNTYEIHIIICLRRTTRRRTDAHCSMKWSSHPGVDPKYSNSFSDNAVVLEPEAIAGIGNRQAFRAVLALSTGNLATIAKGVNFVARDVT